MSQTSHVIILLDRSGSMSAIRQATVDGINDFIDKVNAEPGDGYWTLLQFDDQSSARGAGEQFPKVVFDLVSNDKVRKLEPNDFRPRGGTALIDAMVISLRRMKDNYLTVPEDRRPRVLFVTMTDGHENQSTQHNSQEMRELIAEMQEKHKWQFIYLGANQDAFAEASKYNLRQDYTAGGKQFSNCHNYDHTDRGTRAVFGEVAVGARAWKAEGNQSAAQLLSSAEPDKTDSKEPQP